MPAIQGLRTVVYPVTDLDRAKRFYDEVVGHAPYFDEPFYVGYSVGGYELGLIPDGRPGADGCVVYWGVPDIAAAVARIQSAGATIREEIQEVGGDVKVATLADPFGNSFGVIENPHFKTEE